MKAVSHVVALSALVMSCGWGCPASAGELMMLASGQPDKPAYRAGVGLTSLIKVELLPSRKIDLRTIDTTGPVDNIRRLQESTAELAIVPSAISHAARTGTGPFEGEAPELALRGIAALWRDAIHLAVQTDDVDTGTIDDLLALKSRKLFLGDTTTGMADSSKLLLTELGLDIDQAIDVAAIPNGDGLAAIKRGDIDGFSIAARPPLPMFETVFKDTRSKVRLLDVTEAQMAKANGNHWLWTPYLIPAATYPGQNEDVWTLALSNLLVVKADVDADLVYEITSSIFENLSYLQRVDPMMMDLSLDTALTGMAMPLHPGAMRYFREAGVIPDVTPPATSIDQVAPESDQKPSYPDANVAADTGESSGDPLMIQEPKTSSHEPPTPTLLAPAPSEIPYWRQRATL